MGSVEKMKRILLTWGKLGFNIISEVMMKGSVRMEDYGCGNVAIQLAWLKSVFIRAHSDCFLVVSGQSHCVVRLVSIHAFFTICLQENYSINPKVVGIPRGRIMFR